MSHFVLFNITKADTETQNRENLIKRNFSADKLLKKLLTDITEVQRADGKLYVSSIFGCFNGEIVALEMCDDMKKELCINTVKQLREKYGRLDGTVLHSDRGCQYTSYAFRFGYYNHECRILNMMPYPVIILRKEKKSCRQIVA